MKKMVLFFLLMTSFCWGDDDIELLISSEEISHKIAEVAATINEEYRGEELAIIMVMKGAICVSVDLMRHLEIPFTVDYIKASSYGQQGTQRGELVLKGIEKIDLKDKHVLVVDDIFDSGHTMSTIVNSLQKKQMKSLKTLVLLLKNVPREISYLPDYILFHIENRFVIGYGLDYKEFYRGLPGIYAFVNDTPPASLDEKPN